MPALDDAYLPTYAVGLSSLSPDSSSSPASNAATLLPHHGARSNENVQVDSSSMHEPAAESNLSPQLVDPRPEASLKSDLAAAEQGAGAVSQPLVASESRPAPSSPSGTIAAPIAKLAPPLKQRGLRLALVIMLIYVLAGAGSGAFFLFTRYNAANASSAVVGQALFVSSGQVNDATNQGSNDELQVNLQNIPALSPGKSYYAWLLPDKSQVEAPAILLGKLSVNHGAIHFLYHGDSQHTNLLAITSRFLITEEDANVTPDVPSPNLSDWRYYAEIPQAPAPGQQYSLLDHLRHLLAVDPELEPLHLHGGLTIWTYRNTQQVLQDALNARNDWNEQHFHSAHWQIVTLLDYLDGNTEVARDVPAGTPVVANQQFSQVGLLELDPAHQNPPGYLYHIALHLNGVLSSPGSTSYQRGLAAQINTGLDNVRGWLEQARRDAVQLVNMNYTQLAQPSSLSLLNDLVTQTNKAYAGYTDPSTGQLLSGVSQISLQVQQLATFEVKAYH